MDTLAIHISQLLWRNGSVPVPGIGVFTASVGAARVCNYRLMPPEFRISFLADPYCAAAPLEHSYMRAGATDSAAAASAVANAVAKLRDALDMGEVFAIPHVGALHKDTAGALVFAPVNPLSIGEPIASPVTGTPQVTPEQIARATTAFAERRDALARAVRRTAQSAAAIVMFALLAFVVAQLPSRQAMPCQTASMGTVPVAPYSEAQHEAVVEQPTPILILRTPADACAETQTHAERAAQRLRAQAFCLVVGSLASEAEAKLYMAQHNTEAIPLRLLHSEGRWRVYTVTGPTMAAAIAEGHRQGIFDAYPEAWVCRR